MTIRPNEEQVAIGRAFHTGENLVIEAGAGTGKTSTLELLARKYPSRRMLYIAYNKAIQVEAAQRFPVNVTCKTSHALAYGVTGRTYQSRMNGPRVPARTVARALGLRPVTVEDQVMGPVRLPEWKMAQLVMRTVDRYCHSADREIGPEHVPSVPGLTGARGQLAAHLVPAAVKAWQDLTRPDGQLKFTHDMYLKLYQLGNPRLPYDVILLDEAQDSNPCVSDIVMRQAERAQLVLVGDSCQAIYGWRGAEDAMATFDAKHRLPLTGSYRFGPQSAAEANKWLRLLDAPMRLRGYKQITTGIDDGEEPDAILTRTNGQAIAEVMAGLEQEKRVALVGGGGPIAAMARAAMALMSGASTEHPELMAFSSWDEVQLYVREDPAGSDLAPFVKMVDEYGPDVILDAVNRLSDETGSTTQLTVSTAHKAKGREWKSVRIANDFKIAPDSTPGRSEMMLAYVAVTRARYHLQRGSLSAVDALVAALGDTEQG